MNRPDTIRVSVSSVSISSSKGYDEMITFSSQTRVIDRCPVGRSLQLFNVLDIRVTSDQALCSPSLNDWNER